MRPFNVRDQRFFLLFVACTDPARIPQYVIRTLAGQRHQLDDLLLHALTSLTLGEFREVIEFIRPMEWPSRLEWVMTKVTDRTNDSCQMLRTVLDVLAYDALSSRFVPLLSAMLGMKQVSAARSVATPLRPRVLTRREVCARGIVTC